MHNQINPCLIEDIQAEVAKLANGNTWTIFGSEDNTEFLKKILGYVRESRDIYYHISLPYDLHVILTDEYNDIDLDPEDESDTSYMPPFKLHSPEDTMSAQTINLYICDRAPECTNGRLELGYRIVCIKWCRLFREIPFGIEEIRTSIRHSALEVSDRLKLIIKLIHLVSRVPSLK